ncbi:hypothetical protein PROFUN_08104 [Planoprotostelium fungivorum]|uniref:Uncharacterized protein n=1 Tax=Planoprotostelium fungivorum TaxID=1890364 RepID=A0A2P6NKE8_9EUKA|nr:hypothetical protein PROFUN_08104 [Planoprotostelium fungivorum]
MPEESPPKASNLSPDSADGSDAPKRPKSKGKSIAAAKHATLNFLERDSNTGASRGLINMISPPRERRDTNALALSPRGTHTSPPLSAPPVFNNHHENLLAAIAEVAQSGDHELLAELLRATNSVEYIDALCKDGESPLHIAADWGRTSVVNSLLMLGASVNVRNSHGRTPLHLAATQGHLKICQALLDSGSDASIRDNEGETPLHCSVIHTDILRLILEKTEGDYLWTTSKGYNALHLATYRGCVASMILLANRRYPIDATDNDGNTSLHLAAAAGHVDGVIVLLGAGANLNSVNASGTTALELSRKRFGRKILDYFRSACVDNEMRIDKSILDSLEFSPTSSVDLKVIRRTSDSSIEDLALQLEGGETEAGQLPPSFFERRPSVSHTPSFISAANLSSPRFPPGSPERSPNSRRTRLTPPDEFTTYLFEPNLFKVTKDKATRESQPSQPQFQQPDGVANRGSDPEADSDLQATKINVVDQIGRRGGTAGRRESRVEFRINDRL